MKCIISLLLVLSTLCAQSQVIGITEIEKAIEEKKFSEAGHILKNLTNQYFKSHQADSLVNYIFYAGKIHAASGNIAAGNAAVDKFVEQLKALNPHAAVIKQAYIEAGDYYGFTGNNKKGYESNLKAFEYAQKANSNPSQLALVQNNLSTFSQRTGNVAVMKYHQYKALNFLKSDRNPDYVTMYIAQNGLGSAMYYESKLDSAHFYYQEAVKSLEQAPKDPVNQLYRPAIILNNVAGIYIQQGNSEKAVESMLQVIDRLEKFRKSAAPEQKKSVATSFLYEAIDNLGGIYKDLGDLQRARSLLEYSYKGKKAALTNHDPGIFYSQILLGQLFFAMRDTEKSISFLKEGIANYEKYEPEQWMALGDGYSTLALNYDSRKSYAAAENFYNKADSLYELSLRQTYDVIYLEFLRNKAQFLAERGKHAAAVQVAKKCYDYIVTADGKESLNAFYQLLNFSKIQYIGKNHASALSYAEKALALINQKILSAASLIDSVKLEIYKPRALLCKSLAIYNMPGGKEKIPVILSELDKAIEILERKKGFVNDPENTKVILAENKELFDFVKKLNLELYKSTGNPAYINRIMSLQESALYTRIRSRLDQNDSIRYVRVPQRIIDREKVLNEALKAALSQGNGQNNSLAAYTIAANNIQNFRKELKKNYRSYYEMRYESVINSLGIIREKIKPQTTLLRYFFIDTSLYVFVGDRNKETIIHLNATGLDKLVEQITHSDFKATSQALVKLYAMLWEPVSMHIENEKIVVIPDGILFNINLEILTPKPIKSFRELATKSLMAKYIFSYNYSMFLINKSESMPKSAPVFAGYAPGFSEGLKNTYLNAVQDSFSIDRQYVSLLPQPFTTSLIGRLKNIFGGKSFTETACTRERFINSAGNHHIIHVATHAFSNNIYPEYSKLIFAKKDATSSNELLVSDIYGCDLKSELTVLSACETGKPGYDDGEGMISLAHAFHFSGSNSLVTGLWKIDEKSSAIILESFYKNLKKGLAKDEALRKAKLDFIANQNGRMLSPEYWAGLIIIGDTSPIDFPNQSMGAWWWIGMLSTIICIITTILILRKRKVRNSKLSQ